MTAERRRAAISDIDRLPARIRSAVANLTQSQLDTPYRPEGWTVRQLVHHVADSHVNAYIRLKLALTEDSPRITPYDQAAWATLHDTAMPIDVSLDLLTAIHARWTAVYAALDEAQFTNRRYFHPEIDRTVTLDEQLQTYSWHCRHHVAHITSLRERRGW